MSLEKKLNNLMTTYKKQINDLSRESKTASGQRLRDRYCILNGAKHCLDDGSQNHFYNLTSLWYYLVVLW